VSRIVIPADVVEQTGRTLDAWLPKVLEDTESDWVPYLERLRRDQEVALSEESDLAKRFESFAYGELQRWSPSPPGIGELRDYAEAFGLGRLLEVIEDEISEDRERDREASSKLQSQPRSRLSSAPSERESDEALSQLFRRLTQIPDSI